MLTVANPETFDWVNIALTDCVEGNALDTICTLDLYYIFKDIIEENGQTNLLENLVAKGQIAFTEMEFKGVNVDIDQVNALDEELSELLVTLEANLRKFEEIKEETNVGSDKQMADILFENEDGFCLYPPMRTDGGAPAVNKDSRVLLINLIKIELESRK
jgi:DNA polymerase I-like protein with 3'-5' exonuclease and polymerase domains